MKQSNLFNMIMILGKSKVKYYERLFSFHVENDRLHSRTCHGKEWTRLHIGFSCLCEMTVQRNKATTMFSYCVKKRLLVGTVQELQLKSGFKISSLFRENMIAMLIYS